MGRRDDHRAGTCRDRPDRDLGGPPRSLHLSNGVVWEFEVAKAHKKGAKEFVTRLGGNVS
jgi:hypothetical protein